GEQAARRQRRRRHAHRPARGGRAMALILALLLAHAPVPARTLRLQIRDGRLEGLLAFRLPAQGAQVFAAARDPALAMAPKALAGLRIDGANLKVIEA